MLKRFSVAATSASVTGLYADRMMIRCDPSPSVCVRLGPLTGIVKKPVATSLCTFLCTDPWQPSYLALDSSTSDPVLGSLMAVQLIPGTRFMSTNVLARLTTMPVV